MGGHQFLQMSFTLAGQEGFATAQVGLRFYCAACFEVLANTAHGRHAMTAPRRNLGGAFALLVKFQDAFPHSDRDSSHAHTFAPFTLL
jgi:hypothetical protein